MKTFITLPELRERLENNSNRPRNIKDLLLKSGFKLFLNTTPDRLTLKMLESGYISKDNFKGYSFSFTLEKPNPKNTFPNCYYLIANYEGKGEAPFFEKITPLTGTPYIPIVAYLTYSGDFSDFADFVKRLEIETLEDNLNDKKPILLKYLSAVEDFSEFPEKAKQQLLSNLSYYEYFYSHSFISALKRAKNEEKIDTLLTLRHSYILHRSIRYAYAEKENQEKPFLNRPLADILDYLREKEERPLKGGDHNSIKTRLTNVKAVYRYYSEILQSVYLVENQELEEILKKMKRLSDNALFYISNNIYNARINNALKSQEALKKAGLTLFTENEQALIFEAVKIINTEEDCLTYNEEKEARESQILVINCYLNIRLNLEPLKRSLEQNALTFEEIKEDAELLPRLETAFREVFIPINASLIDNLLPKEEEASATIPEKAKTGEEEEREETQRALYIKSAPLFATILQGAPGFEPAKSKSDQERINAYREGISNYLNRVLDINRRLEQIKESLKELSPYNPEELTTIQVLNEERENLERERANIEAEKKKLSLDIAFNEAGEGFINKNLPETYRDNGAIEVVLGDKISLIIKEEEAIKYSEFTSYILGLCFLKASASGDYHLFFSNEEILQVYINNKTFTKTGFTDQENEIREARRIFAEQLSIIYEMSTKQVKTNIQQIDKTLSRKSKRFIASWDNTRPGGIYLTFSEELTQLIKNYKSKEILNAISQKASPSAWKLYFVLVNYVNTNKDFNGSYFSLSYKALMKISNYRDKDKYTGKNPTRDLVEPISRDAEELEDLGLIKINHNIESVNDYLEGWISEGEYYETAKKEASYYRDKARRKRKKRQAEKREGL